jgi:hypothetical protein
MKFLLKLLILVCFSLFSYYIGWGNGQASAYAKIEHTPSLFDLLYK